MKDNKELHWNLICRYHSETVVGLMREELSAAPISAREAVWRQWETFLGRRGGTAREDEILKLSILSLFLRLVL